MIEFLLSLTITCAAPKIINTSGYKWNTFDQKTLNRVITRCPELYPKSPCVKKFYKRDKMTYHVICGAK